MLPANYGFNLNMKCTAKNQTALSPPAFVALNAKAKVAKCVEKSILLDQLLLNMS